MRNADQLLSRVADAARRGALAEAESLCRSLLESSPRHFFAWFVLGDVLARGNRMGEALAAYETASRINPGHSAPFSRTAIIRFRMAFGQPSRPRHVKGEGSGGRVQMTRLGFYGRFGNQLLQYAFVRFHAEEYNLIAEFPDWIGRDLFDLDDAYPSASLPRVDEREFDVSGALSGAVGTALFERDVTGFFCGSTAEWGDRAARFRTLFTPGAKIRPLLDRAWQAVHSAGKTIVAIHLRRADFGYGRFWVAPAEWYLDWLRAIWPGLDNPVLYVATDDRTVLPKFAEFSPWDSSRIGVDIPGADFMLDHHILRHAAHVAISNSTFSFTAAMLNDRALSFMRPHPNRRELVPFEPWSATVLLDAVLEHSDTAAADRMVLAQHFRADDFVVHVGQYCSPWTHLARSLQPDMRIHELEEGASVDQFLRQNGHRHITHLVVEDLYSLPHTLDGASETLSRSGIDMVHFFLSPKIAVATAFGELERKGFRVFVSPDGTLKPADGAAPLAPGRYVAVQERALKGRAEP